MKYLKLKFVLILFLLHNIGMAQEKTSTNISIIPQPNELTIIEGSYVLPKQSVICFSEGAENSAAWLQQMLNYTYVESYAMKGNNCVGFSLELNEDLEETLGTEGYQLEVTKDVVSMKAATETGLFYAIQTFRQLLPAEIEQKKLTAKIKLPRLKIVDAPRFSWRGSMLDISRSFFGMDYLKRHLDRMALYKLNRLHLHLSDDQGWRIEIKDYPKLTEIGGKSAVKNGRSGFLTREDYKELQEYAKARNIVIVPEIDMPGHTYAALLAYPELNCEDYTNLDPQLATPPQMYQEYTVGWSKLCLEKPEVYDFVSKVIADLAEMTSGDYIHIGGDEIEDERYKEFVVKADSIVRANGKTTIGWEEVTQAQVSPEFISQRWNGKTQKVVDVRVIESICTNFYFDHANEPGQENTNNWCQKRGVSLEDAYVFNSDDPNVIGIEAPVWTELVTTNDMADERLWPRSIAAAEVGWTQPKNKELKKFRKRLGEHGKRMNYLNINFYRTSGINWNVDNMNGIFSGFMPGDK